MGVEGLLREALSHVKKIQIAFIYGSFAGGKEKSSSDIDLMVIGDPDSPGLHSEISVLERKLKREINISTYTTEEYKEKKKEKSGFILDLLRNPKIMLIGTENDL
ncbi:MAG: nucleotidyltransferase domain-containing protein [Candidatus Omnitrophica bacterium]|nr:nucleotidyltransferase domain-containing protein [Candidatus Omnitrophota bacterium]